MAQALVAGDGIFVPRSRVGLSLAAPSAIYQTTVLEVARRRVRVALPNANDAWVASSLVHRTLGVLVLRIGDFSTETTLLDPLAKSLLQFLRLLLTDEFAKLHEIRSPEELEAIWTAEHGLYSHVVLVGHGRKNALRFGIGGWIGAQSLADLLARPAGITCKTVISLCCATAYMEFARPMSRSDAVLGYIAPLRDAHGAIASQFAQTYLSHHFLSGETLTPAFKHSRNVPGGSTFRLWKDGKLIAGAS